MDNAILTSVITGMFTLVGVIVSNMLARKKNEQTMAVSQAVINTKIENLTVEVREHNNFARRMPVLEHDVKDLQRRVTSLEGYHKQPVNPAN